MLNQVGELSVAAEDGYRFVVAKRLKVEAKSSAASLLTAMLQHPAYRDTFLNPDSAPHDNVDMHGPFVLSDIRLEDFEITLSDLGNLALRQSRTSWTDSFLAMEEI